mgnify:CR=1 FL=1
MTPLAGVHVLGRGHISYIMKMHYFFKNRFLYSQYQFRPTKYNVYSNDDHKKVHQNCKFHDPRAGVLVLGRGQISHIVKMHYFFKNLLLYSQA